MYCGEGENRTVVGRVAKGIVAEHNGVEASLEAAFEFRIWKSRSQLTRFLDRTPVLDHVDFSTSLVYNPTTESSIQSNLVWRRLRQQLLFQNTIYTPSSRK
jgi:hypothetical protein